MVDRVIELAIETLESRKAAIEAEISQLRAQVKSPRSVRTGTAGKKAKPSRGPRSAAARRAQSERMKLYWAKKRADAAKNGKTGPKKS